MRRLGWLCAAGAVVCVVAWALALAPRGGEPAPKLTRGSVSVAPASPAATASLPPRAASIADVAEDGRLVAGAGGDLVVDVELRRFFDFYLSASGEEPLEVTRARLLRIIDERLPPRAAAQARELLDRYLAMRERGRTLVAAPSEDLAVRLAAVHELRRDALGAAAAEAMFGAEEAEAREALARRAVVAPSGPPDPSLVPLATMRAEVGRAPDEVRALREQAFGRDGAARLAAVDEQRAAWERRLAEFRERRAALAPDAADALLRATFSPEEQLRVRALERAAGRPLD